MSFGSLKCGRLEQFPLARAVFEEVFISAIFLHFDFSKDMKKRWVI
jgi:hypothetical protein